MKKICIVGRGRWAQRLKNRFERQGAEVTLLDSRAENIDVAPYPEVVICVPAYCAGEVLEKINWGTEKKNITSCVKGMLADGRTLRQHLNENYSEILSGPANFLGGPNIDDGREIVIIESGDKLELACILKNVYAIGFGLALNQGENFAAQELAKYLAEYKKMEIPEAYWADLLVSCYSDKSRNKTFGRKFSHHENYNEKTIEGLNSARIIEQHDLLNDLTELRNITRILSGKND